jgi:hypothetical protein
VSNHPTDEDLLGLIDRELAEVRSTGIAGHLQGCTACAARYRRLAEASSDSTTIWRQNGPRFADPALRERLHEAMTAAIARRHARRVSIAVALTAALLFLTVRYESALLGRSFDTKALEKGALPVASFTPGAAQDVGVREVCRSSRRIAPPIPEAVRRQVLRDYGMEQVPEEEYELDYLITPELGGIPDRRNLWPERYASRSWNAHAKDALEHVLPQLVCHGRIDLATAQREMATNWIVAYKKYLATEHPVQLHARVLAPARSPLGLEPSY